MTMKNTKMYTVIWKYKIKPENKEKFEFEYGRNGTWAKLFAKSKNYRGSLLYKSEDEVDTYILMDTWINKQSYEDFIETNKEKYNKTSAGFEYLYLSEEKTESFNAVQ